MEEAVVGRVDRKLEVAVQESVGDALLKRLDQPMDAPQLNDPLELPERDEPELE